MHKVIIDCGSALNKLNRLHNGEIYSIFKSLHIFTNAPTIILKHNKERDPPSKHIPSLSWRYSLQALTQPCSLLYSTLEITAIDVGPCGKPWTQATHSSWLGLPGHSLISHMCALADRVPKTADYNAQRQSRIIWPCSHRSSLCIIWMHANKGKYSQNVCSSSRFLFIGRDMGYSRMW